MTSHRPNPVPRHAVPPAQDAPSGDAAPQRSSWRSAPSFVVRGGMVGVAESVPGISGGTVALVVGLYDGLIDAAGQTLHAGRELVRGVVRREGLASGRRALREVDWPMLLPVLVGMATFLLVSLQIVAPLLEAHPVPVRAVFFGMIAVSVLVPLRLLPGRFRVVDGALLALGAAVAFLLTGLPPADLVDPPLWLVFVGAAIAINALVLPGVSGSFILLAMGLYIPVQQALSDRDLQFVGVFALGAAVGLGSFVKLLQWLLHHRRQVTMATLAGLMVGSLRALWPWQDEAAGLEAPSGSVAATVALALAGAAVAGLAIWWESRGGRES
ncbi:DUF368 domain-containing protein [Oerskovia flava]|uniref:DUF368 domain-containing protein n=1 Tax=Oerskovia flava TaxID=2986422 RepID=UPI00223F33CF|nr:DUF368 domain-containing protein [Oerskovia sp. JB1-3-2]